MNGDLHVDPELADLFPGEPELLDVARRARAAHPEGVVRQQFRASLREQLMADAPRHLRPRSGLRLRLRGPFVAGGLATIGVAMAAVALVSVLHGGGHDNTVVAIRSSATTIQAGAVDVDPERAIVIAFNQPMDHGSVERAIHIEPATTYRTTWNDATNSVSVVPDHHLAASTAYVVRLESTAASTTGEHLQAPVVIPFGTRPTPAPSPTPMSTPAPPLPAVVARALAGSPLVAAQDGGLLLGAGLPPAPTASPTASPTPTATPTAVPTAIGQAAPSPTATPDVARGPVLLRVGDGVSASSGTPSSPAPGQPVTGGAPIGPQATALAVAPTGRTVAYAVGRGDRAEIAVAALDGTQARTLVTTADVATPLAWTESGILFTTGGGHVQVVTLTGVSRDAGLPPLTPGGPPLVVRDGHRAAVLAAPPRPAPAASTPASTAPTAAVTATPAPPAGTRLADLGGGPVLELPGATGALAVSADASTVAWVVRSGGTATLDRAAVPTNLGSPLQPAPVNLGRPLDDVTAVALSDDGGEAAASVTRGGDVELRVVSPSGAVLTVPGLTRPTFLSRAAVVGLGAAAADGSVGVAVVHVSDPAAVGGVPAAATVLLDALVAAQASGNAQQLRQLQVTGSPPPDLAAQTPAGITQAYVVATTAAAPDTVSARVRLLRIQSAGAPTAADETVTLAHLADGSWAVARLDSAPLQPVVAGPHVQHVAVGPGPARTVLVTFDADLDAATVAAAVSVAGGTLLPGGVAYDATARTITVALPPTLSGAPETVTVTISSALRDVNGHPLASPSVTTLSV